MQPFCALRCGLRFGICTSHVLIVSWQCLRKKAITWATSQKPTKAAFQRNWNSRKQSETVGSKSLASSSISAAALCKSDSRRVSNHIEKPIKGLDGRLNVANIQTNGLVLEEVPGEAVYQVLGQEAHTLEDVNHIGQRGP